MKKIVELYNKNKGSKVGDELVCPGCNGRFVKTNYQQAFCKNKTGTKCKDKYWNTVTPNKRNNTTRISPASRLWLQKEAIKRGFPSHNARKEYIDDFDGSWDSHDCYVAPCEWCGMRSEYCRCE